MKNWHILLTFILTIKSLFATNIPLPNPSLFWEVDSRFQGEHCYSNTFFDDRRGNIKTSILKYGTPQQPQYTYFIYELIEEDAVYCPEDKPHYGRWKSYDYRYPNEYKRIVPITPIVTNVYLTEYSSPYASLEKSTRFNFVFIPQGATIHIYQTDSKTLVKQLYFEPQVIDSEDENAFDKISPTSLDFTEAWESLPAGRYIIVFQSGNQRFSQQMFKVIH
ncbi:MAG TPA: hypothetical protein PKC21_02935 [Oligoflexia bacterium]|nr:hypothetical protein [Oligoflexia bacterium]HMR24288.1 hypothetical protein [Oligoflexia bacterium]